MITRLLCYALGIVIGFLIAVVYAQHGGWQDRYTNETGMRCCGPADCKVVPVSILTHDGIKVEALVMGIRVTVPAQSVHQSEDMQSWWCRRDTEQLPSNENVRCLFYAVGS